MKVQFDEHKNKTVSTGYATVVIVDGVAEIDENDEAQIILAKSLGGKKFTPSKGPDPQNKPKTEYLIGPENAPLAKVKDRVKTKRGKK